MTVPLLVLLLGTAQPQAATPPTQADSARETYENVKRFILASAEKMPADQFAFQPTADVRSFGQILAHVADGNYLLCAPALGDPPPDAKSIDKIEKEKLAREPLIERLKTSFGYCDKAYAALSDANAGDPLTLFRRQRPRLALLWFHISHAYEHYGNLVTYLRLKGVVPPSSERTSR